MSCSEFELYELYDKFGEEAEEREGGWYGERCREPPPLLVLATTVFFSAAALPLSEPFGTPPLVCELRGREGAPARGGGGGRMTLGGGMGGLMEVVS